MYSVAPLTHGRLITEIAQDLNMYFSVWMQAGGYWSSLLDRYSAGFPIIVFALLETVGISWIYGTKRFVNDIRTMIGDGPIDFLWGIPFMIWPVLWSVITPAVLMVSF